MTGKKTLERQNILIAEMENKDELYSTFSKRWARLYKKTSDMIGKHNINVGIIIFFPIDNLSFFFYPSIDAVVDHF